MSYEIWSYVMSEGTFHVIRHVIRPSPQWPRLS
jgi:hypothetical protein